MVQKIIGIIFLFGLLILPVNAETRKINDLVENAKALDYQTVTIQAEAIGEILERGEYAWVNVNDQSNAIGVFVPIEEAEKIKFFGDYFHQGDTLLITGVLYNACKEHGGELDIHAKTITVVSVGQRLDKPINSQKTLIFVGFAFLASILGVYFYQVAKPKRIRDASSEEIDE